jgi:DNA-binding HxlR family transcriptional regulator
MTAKKTTPKSSRKSDVHGRNCVHGCAVTSTVALIGGKWKTVALYHLMDGPHRFSELQRKLAGVTQRMLTLQLRELEADGLVHRKVYAQVPPKVEYSLTELGRTLEPIVRAMLEWGEAYQQLATAELS